MRTVQDWLDEYAVSHKNHTNKTIHWICVPAIMLSLIGLLWAIPVPAFAAAVSPFLNWAALFVIFAFAYYLMLSPKLAVGMVPVVAVMLAINYFIWLQVGSWIWLVSFGIFFVAWVGQFIGHKIEGMKPSFFKDLQFLLIGPLWLLSFLYRAAGLTY